MNISIYEIDPSIQLRELKRIISSSLRDIRVNRRPVPLTLDISILPLQVDGQCRTGRMIIPVHDIGRLFLREYGGLTPRKLLEVGGRALRFIPSPAPPSQGQERTHALQEERFRAEQDSVVHTASIPVSSIQFGWECRDGIYSVEHEIGCGGPLGSLYFDAQRRQFRIQLKSFVVALRAAQISWVSSGEVSGPGPKVTILFFSLAYSPTFETAGQQYTPTNPRHSPLSSRPSGRRLTALDPTHAAITQYVGSSLRVVCPNVIPARHSPNCNAPGRPTSSPLPPSVCERFRHLCVQAHITIRVHIHHPIPRRIFAPCVQESYAKWLSKECDWKVAFQVDRLARDNIFDLKELLHLRPHLLRLKRERGVTRAASFIRYIGDQAAVFPWWKKSETDKGDFDFVMKLWVRCKNRFIPLLLEENTDETFDCYHAIVTPTGFFLDGPFPERKNRVIRKYEDHISHFLRVSFLDEDGREIHWDREAISARAHKEFCHTRFGSIFSDGLTVAGRHFEFLGYSQSGLKQRTFWFVTPFELEITDAFGGKMLKRMTPAAIVEDLGVFRGVEYDEKLMYCPARYGARIGQNFTATEAAVAVDTNEVKVSWLPDIKDAGGVRSFTDGVGTISEEFAAVIWKTMKERGSHHRRPNALVPKAFQIRYKGCKGMLSVDHELSGLCMILRPSMTKFEAPNSTTLEIVAAFNKPGRFYLNRPLIMLLEGLGVGYDVFERLLSAVVQDTKDAMKSAKSAARLLEGNGLGISFKLSSIFTTLEKLGFDAPPGAFFGELLNSAVYHILRDLKYRARIPVPNGYTLVGVADVHGYLEEGQIFACIDHNDGRGPQYLEGPTLIARSPVIHPGDVRIVHATGCPPPGTPFAKEPLTNTIVFATRGTRPLASCLAGGDLDGDVFVLTTMKDLLPTTTFPPAEYNPARRKTIPHESTLQDIGQFATEALYSDNIGIIAKAWLLLADQAPQAVLSSECRRLAELHSDATDYPKTGMPVRIEDIPRPRLSSKPDWDSPEVSMEGSQTLYYPSERHIGRLFREVRLSEVPNPQTPPPASRRELADFPSSKDLRNLFCETYTPADSLEAKIHGLVTQHLDVNAVSPKCVDECREVFVDYRWRLQQICFTRGLFQRHGAMLSEVEVVVGTITTPATHPKARKEKIAELREHATSLANDISKWIAGSNGDEVSTLERAWTAWRMSCVQPEAFGSQSFKLLALNELIDAVENAVPVEPVEEVAET